MTTAAQRIREAIYAAEFVHRLHEVHADDHEGRERGVKRALDMADAAVRIFSQRAIVKESGPVSRFRRRSR